MSAVPLSEIQQHLQMTVGTNDELQRFVDAAETAIGHRVGPLTPESRVEKHPGGGSLIILRSPRAVSLTSIGYADGSTGSLGDFDLDTDTGIIYLAYGSATGRFPCGYGAASSRFVTVTYQAGWETLPEDLRQAVKELVRHLWETQRGANTGARPGFADTEDVPSVGDFGSWPPRVQQLVEPYQVPKVA